MTGLYAAMAIFLLLNIAAGMTRVLRGPHPADRMLAAQMFGTFGVAIFLLLAFAMDRPALVDVALAMAPLGVIALVAFVSRVWRRIDGRGP